LTQSATRSPAHKVAAVEKCAPRSRTCQDKEILRGSRHSKFDLISLQTRFGVFLYTFEKWTALSLLLGMVLFLAPVLSQFFRHSNISPPIDRSWCRHRALIFGRASF
jgi:hypothetical protein